MMERWNDDIKMNPTDTGCEDRICMEVVQETYPLSERGIRIVEHCSTATVLVR
jgi:hypothetical protein